MKIAILTEFFLFGGLETRLKSISKYLLEEGHEVVLVAWKIDKKAHSYLPFTSIYSADFSDPEEVEKVLAKINPDVVDIHPFSSIVSGAISCDKLGLPYSVTIHGVYVEPLYFPALQNATWVFAVSEEVKAQILSVIPPREVIVLPNGVDMAVFCPVKAGKGLSVAYVSRLDLNKRKGIIHAAKVIMKKPGAKLYIIGSGSAGKRLKEELPKVEFQGYIENISGYFQENPGRYSVIGGMGRSIIEGIAMKMKVLIMGYDGLKGWVTPDNFYELAKNNFSGWGLPNIEELPETEDFTETLYQIVCKDYDIKKITGQYQRIIQRTGENSNAD